MSPNRFTAVILATGNRPRLLKERGLLELSAMTKIAVTGGSGKAGRAVVRDLLEHGHQVLNIDRVPSPESQAPDSPVPFLSADLTDFGQALEALSGGETMPRASGSPSRQISAERRASSSQPAIP